MPNSKRHLKKFILAICLLFVVTVIIYHPASQLTTFRDHLGIITPNNRRITYQIDSRIPARYHLSKFANKTNYMAVWTLHNGKKLVAIRRYDLFDTFKSLRHAPAPYQLSTPNFTFLEISGYIPAKYLHRVHPVVKQRSLARRPYYLNSFDGYHTTNDYKMTTMRLWNAVPGSQPNVTSNDVTPYMYQQLYAIQTATNNQGRTYLQLRTKSKIIGWIRNSFQLSRGKYVDPATRLLHVNKTERLTKQIQPLATRHGYHLSQRVYNVYDHQGHLSRSLAMSYLFYPNLFIIKNNRVVTAKFYDHHDHVIKVVHDPKDLRKSVTPKPGLVDERLENSRQVTFGSQANEKLYTLTDGFPDPESTYGTITVLANGQAKMKSSGMGSLE